MNRSKNSTLSSNPPEVAAIIPARGGSKGLPRKNILMLGDHPLLAWSIRVCQASSLITRVLVSTEDTEIARISREYDAEVPFLRPSHLAGDDITVTPAVSHLIKTLQKEEGYIPDFFAVLYPTSPFRTPETIDFLISKAIEGFHPVNTVILVEINDADLHVPDKYGRLKPLLTKIETTGGSIGFTRGCGYISVNNDQGHILNPYNHLIDEGVETIDIDYASDLRLAEMALQEGLVAWKP